LCFYIFISYLFSSVLNNHDLPLKLLAKAPRARHKHLLTAYLACSILLDLLQAPFSINLARSVSLDLPQAPFSINLARSVSLDLPQAPFSINLARGDRLYGEQERPWPDD